MKFWKNHPKLRVTVMLGLLIAGLFLTLYGWSLTGQLLGLGYMLLGIVFLLTALFVYNRPYSGKA